MDCMVGFSAEAIIQALGGGLDPLLDAVKSGAVRGIAGVVGCNNPKIKHDYGHVGLLEKLIANDVLVVTTGCNAIAAAKAGLMLPEAADRAGEGLRAASAKPVGRSSRSPHGILCGHSAASCSSVPQ